LPDENKVCNFCGSSDNLKKFDTSPNFYCSLNHFQEYWKSHGLQQVASHEALSAQEILKITEQDNVFIKNLPDDSNEANYQKRLKIIEERIILLKQLEQSARLSQRNMAKELHVMAEKRDGDRTRRYRQQGVSSDVELKEKRLSKIERMILSWRKMNLADDFIAEKLSVSTGGKYSTDQIKGIMKGLK